MTTVTIIFAEPNMDNHVCKFPSPCYGKWVDKDKSPWAINAVAKCECGKTYVLRQGYTENSFTWTPLAWYHRQAKRNLRTSNDS